MVVDGWRPEGDEVMRAMRTVAFVLLLVGLCASVAYGLSVGDFWETVTNGVMICLTCIGVA
jgi:hypothetical protein